MSFDSIQTYQSLRQESHHATRDERIARAYSFPQARFIRQTLSPEELDTIDTTEGMDVSDYLSIAIANTLVRTKPSVAKRYDSYNRHDLPHYMATTQNWLKTEAFLLGARNGRPPLPNEIAKDFFSNNNGGRHRVFYCLRYPDKVQKP